MLTEKIFEELVIAASMAPSADNMQPWEFRKQSNTIEVFCARQRILPTDVIEMFAWVGVGAAIQNIVVAAANYGLLATVNYASNYKTDNPAAVIQFMAGNTDNKLVQYIEKRNTNRSPYNPVPLDPALISKLSQSIQSFEAGIHWTTSASDFDTMAKMDANSSYIRLEHKPLHDELFDILRFTKKDNEKYRFGLTFESLEVPKFAVFFARQLQYWAVTKAISRLGFSRMVAKQLSDKLRKTGAICVLTALKRTKIAYMEAGRAMENMWLAATAEGLSVQPYGVLPQYLTKVEIEPKTFLPKHINIIKNHINPFYTVFSGAKQEFPAIVLRVGHTNNLSARSDIRLKPEQIIRK